MKASEAPTLGDAGWNAFRARLVATLFDIEAELQQRGSGMNTQGLTCEAAERLGLEINTEHDYLVLEKVVAGLRTLTTESIRRTREEGRGQFSLPL